MTTFLSAFGTVHTRSLAFAAALPLVAAIPLVAEFIQHVVEMRSGMYAGPEVAQALEGDPDRMIAGFFKTVALGLPAYFLIRWLHTQGDRAFASRLDKRAVTLFALVIALQALLAWLGLYVWTEGPMSIGFFVFGLIFMPLIVRFVVAAPLGSFISPLQSIRVMAPDALFAILFPLIAILPLMVLHYALGIGAIFVESTALKWGMLALDSVVTAGLALVMIAAQYVTATRPAPIEASSGSVAG
ncbi:hypothetical protein N6L26_09790 [Qipengyuania sp. SS22]|uniref:hypothetical protein n=1 Tax=Qipengyuania sp. SS22 TaxID=2979461 RepID=UPI0021E57FA5|nr:hypothetical protein [Qipengyuania sp. SS22]UYH54342.1 hypothetical protein N6L26_09790 [Qipengyuania sp. SS22]